jgi:hypothetical protein
MCCSDSKDELTSGKRINSDILPAEEDLCL